MTIAEVSKQYDITADTLRYYERIGLIPRVTRTASGIRAYSAQECERVAFVKCMRTAGISIEALIEYFTLFEQGDTTITARKELLEEERRKLRDKLEEIQNTLKRLDYKIGVYQEAEKTGKVVWTKQENDSY